VVTLIEVASMEPGGFARRGGELLRVSLNCFDATTALAEPEYPSNPDVGRNADRFQYVDGVAQ